MLHYGAISMAMGTVVTGIGSYQFALTSVAALYIGWGLWWISVALAAISSVLLVYLLVSKQTKSIESVTGAWLLLAAPLTVCAASGATIAEYLPTNLALTTIVAGYFLLGAGMALTCCLLVLYVHRITVYKLPARDIVLTSFIPLGPISQIGVASITLGRIAQEVVPTALPHIEALGAAMFYVGIIGALASWGCALFALAHAVFSVVYEQRSSRIPFTISWWALVFPIGVFSRLTVDLSQTMQLGFFKVVHLMLVTALFALWLFNMVRTAVGVWTGSIFGISELTGDCKCCACKGDGTQKPEEARASGCEDKLVIMGKSGAGKTSMRLLIFSNYTANDTRRLGATIDVEHSTVQFMGDLNLNIWDCGGQHKYLDNYLNEQKENIFGNVEVLIYVFDLETTNKDSEYVLYDECLHSLATYSREAKVYCLVHKMDKIPDAEQKAHTVEQYRRALAKRSDLFKPEVFGTSIWDYTLYHAWSQIVYKLVPNMATIERHLSSFRQLSEACEVVLFERATFLVVCSVGAWEQAGAAAQALDKYMSVSQSIKTYRYTCGQMQLPFQNIEMRNKRYSLFIEPFTKSTYILVVTTDADVEPAVTKANINAARQHFARLAD
ncbi:hypothetical protein LPJ53_003904 [Coemansia erecta]|uniref:GTP-binding protein n=1 Tax=Coemansia erecta TaxID=147472 RepID=A0A9W7XZP6_9FUNG|nr:hypothetical protein LPJ53_003904 [Coemansia erecta]